MQFPTENPRVAPQLRVQFLFVGLVLLAAGGSLFFFADEARLLWPWQVGSFNTLFLGAIYLAAFAVVMVALWYGRWSPVRLVLPMVFVFTATVLLVSVLHLGRFDFARWSTWLWFMLYAAVPANAAIHMWRYREMPVPAVFTTPMPWRVVLTGLAVLLGLYGVGMFLAPEVFTYFWPWPVDGFHGRLYSVAFTTLAVGALGLTSLAAPLERLTLGVGYSTLGLFALFSVVIADARLGSINMAEPGTLMWFSLFGLLFAAGLLMVWWSSLTRDGAG